MIKYRKRLGGRAILEPLEAHHERGADVRSALQARARRPAAQRTERLLENGHNAKASFGPAHTTLRAAVVSEHGQEIRSRKRPRKSRLASGHQCQISREL